MSKGNGALYHFFSSDWGKRIKKMKNVIRNCVGAFSAYHDLVLYFLLFSLYSAAYAADVTPVNDGARRIFMQRGTEQIAVFDSEIVSDRKAMQQGLSGRSSMPDDHGMLFVLDSSTEHSFWMKGMEFPVDILFFAEDKSLTEVLSKLMPCKECQSYKAPVHTAYALEINAGLAEALGVRKGDRFVCETK
jgi:uncharacterized membrane protein (UPF0127 family)